MIRLRTWGYTATGMRSSAAVNANLGLPRIGIALSEVVLLLLGQRHRDKGGFLVRPALLCIVFLYSLRLGMDLGDDLGT